MLTGYWLCLTHHNIDVVKIICIREYVCVIVYIQIIYISDILIELKIIVEGTINSPYVVAH